MIKKSAEIKILNAMRINRILFKQLLLDYTSHYFITSLPKKF